MQVLSMEVQSIYIQDLLLRLQLFVFHFSVFRLHPISIFSFQPKFHVYLSLALYVVSVFTAVPFYLYSISTVFSILMTAVSCECVLSLHNTK